MGATPWIASLEAEHGNAEDSFASGAFIGGKDQYTNMYRDVFAANVNIDRCLLFDNSLYYPQTSYLQDVVYYFLFDTEHAN